MIGVVTYTDEEKAALWKEYWGTKSKSSYSRLGEAYLPLLETVASIRKQQLPDYIEVDELINAGYEGLADAIFKFDPSGGYKFETYATIRINGAITDSLRDVDKVSRHYRAQFKHLSAVNDELTASLGCMPTKKELAEALGWSENQLTRVTGVLLSSREVSLEGIFQDSASSTPSEGNFSPQEYLTDLTIVDPVESLHIEELTALFAEALEGLTEKEAQVVALHAIEGHSFKEIARIMGVTDARPNALYQSAISKIVAKLEI